MPLRSVQHITCRSKQCGHIVKVSVTVIEGVRGGAAGAHFLGRSSSKPAILISGCSCVKQPVLTELSVWTKAFTTE